MATKEDAYVVVVVVADTRTVCGDFLNPLLVTPLQ